MRKIIAITVVLAGFAMLVGLGVTSAGADEDDEVEWVLVGTQYRAEVEVSDTVIGPIEISFGITLPVEGEDIQTEIEVITAANEIEDEGPDAEKFEIEIIFDDGVPIEAQATLSTFIEGCGEVTIETKFEGGEYGREEEVNFSSEGTPLFRGTALGLGDVEIREAVICGIDMLGEILGDGEIEALIESAEFFVPAGE